MSPDDVAFLKSFDSTVANFGTLRNALDYALGISPLCLLLPTVLSKKSVNHKTLIEVCWPRYQAQISMNLLNFILDKY
jgi:hypothetical protein